MVNPTDKDTKHIKAKARVQRGTLSILNRQKSQGKLSWCGEQKVNKQTKQQQKNKQNVHYTSDRIHCAPETS